MTHPTIPELKALLEDAITALLDAGFDGPSRDNPICISWTDLSPGQHHPDCLISRLRAAAAALGEPEPVDMVLYCPICGGQHIDAPDERTPGWVNPPHKSHLCHGCGHIWRPADVPTNGVAKITTVGKADSPAPRGRQIRINPDNSGTDDYYPQPQDGVVYDV